MNFLIIYFFIGFSIYSLIVSHNWPIFKEIIEKHYKSTLFTIFVIIICAIIYTIIWPISIFDRK